MPSSRGVQQAGVPAQATSVLSSKTPYTRLHEGRGVATEGHGFGPNAAATAGSDATKPARFKRLSTMGDLAGGRAFDAVPKQVPEEDWEKYVKKTT